jgi:ABC-type transporter Mla MlaB component
MSTNDISQEIYRRIYRLANQNIDARRIAATVKLPVRTVRTVLGRFFNTENPDDLPHEHDLLVNENELGIFVFTKSRYAILDLWGPLVEQNLPQLSAELDSLMVSVNRAVAVRLSDVSALDEAAITMLLDYRERYTARGRYLGLLDPAPELEQIISSKQLESKIPVFGTEGAFEDNAFKVPAREDKKSKPHS